MSAREVAFLVIRDTFGSPPRGSQAAFDYRIGKSELDERDRAFAAELAYGTIKARRLLDFWLKPFVGERAATLPFSISEILRLGAYQLLCMNGVAAHAAVYETVALAMRYGHKGTAGLVNAILRRIERESPAPPMLADFDNALEFIATRESLPTWILERLAGRFGSDMLEPICSGLNQAPQHALSVHTKRHTLADVQAFLAAEEASWTLSPYVADTLISPDAGALRAAERAGFGVVQSESAAMPVDLLAVTADESVLELCAGRGNKTLQLLDRLGAGGNLEVLELDARKVAALGERLAGRGDAKVQLHASDATKTEGDLVDALLIDAPCSGLGVIGRHPEARWRKDATDAMRHSETQMALLTGAAKRLKSGGRLVYSVCSPDPCEGEAVIDRFLMRTSDFERMPMPERYAEFTAYADEGDVVVPPGIAGRDGFFVSMLRRR